MNMTKREKDTGLPKHVPGPSRTTLWKQNNRQRYNDYQREYMRKYRAKKRERELSYSATASLALD